MADAVDACLATPNPNTMVQATTLQATLLAALDELRDGDAGWMILSTLRHLRKHWENRQRRRLGDGYTN